VPVTSISTGFPSNFLSNFDATTLQLYLYDKKPLFPEIVNFNTTVQRELPGGVVLEVAFAGSQGSHIVTGSDANQPYPTDNPNSSPQSRRPYPGLGAFDVITTSGKSHYNSLQVKVEKRYSNGLTFLAGYSWAHSTDSAPLVYTLGNGDPGGAYYDWFRDARHTNIDYGNSSFDVRHRFVLSWLYDLPFGRGKKFGANWNPVVDHVLGGWRIGGIDQFQSGFHFTAVTYNDPSNSTIYSFAGGAIPDVLRNPYDFSYGHDVQTANGCPVGHQSLQCWFNPAAFGYPQPGHFGNEGRNALVGPSLVTVDLSLFKEFRIAEKKRLEFRGEFFNIPNRANFALPDNTVESGTFGHLLSTRADPRDIQFALRLVF